MKVVYTPDHKLHDPQVEIENSLANSPLENTERAERIRDTLAGNAAFDLVAPTPWALDPIVAVHDPGLVRFLSSAWADYQAAMGPTREVVPDVFYRPSLRRAMSAADEPVPVNARLGWWCFETTTPLTEGTYHAARGAVDVALTAMGHVLDGARHAYGLCRPPGHHATSGLYGGYCFFNNAAIVAHHLATTTHSKVAVLDVDFHHGNGTQEIFYERDDVFYASLHGDPTRAYPYYSGHVDETGAGRGRGANLNVPLAARVEDDEYEALLQEVCDSLARFGADFVVVSLGLDTFVTDPICDLSLSTEGFRRCGAVVGALGLPTIVLQEGGYDIDHLGANVEAWLEGLARSTV